MDKKVFIGWGAGLDQNAVNCGEHATEQAAVDAVKAAGYELLEVEVEYRP